MAHLAALNTRRVKEINAAVEERWGAAFSTDDIWYLHDKDQDVFLLSAMAKQVDFEHLRINNLGLYILNLDSGGRPRLSIEGSQLLGPKATRNVITLDDVQARNWVRGEDMDMSSLADEPTGWFLVRSSKDWMGSGLVKEGRLLNFVPKARRVQSKD